MDTIRYLINENTVLLVYLAIPFLAYYGNLLFDPKLMCKDKSMCTEKFAKHNTKKSYVMGSHKLP